MESGHVVAGTRPGWPEVVAPGTSSKREPLSEKDESGLFLCAPTPPILMPVAKARSPANGMRKPRTYATGGGDATASGVAFQQSLGAAFSLWMLTETPVDPRLALGGATVVTVRMETEAPLDDVLVLTSDGGIIAAQAKINLSLSSTLTSEFGKTLGQLVRHWLLCRYGSGALGWDRPLDEARDRLLIVVGPNSPATTRLHLARALEARRQPGKPLLAENESRALDQFNTCVRLAWKASTTEPLTDCIQGSLFRLTFVYTFDPSGISRAAMAATLVPALAEPADASSVLNLLERSAEDLMSSRGGHGIATLRADLIGRGARLAVRSDYRGDIAALKSHSAQTERALRALEVMEAEAGVPVGIARHCQPAVNAAALTGGLLLIGEPGAGKSAVMNVLGRSLRDLGHDVVELAVDRFSVESLEGLSRALGLGHDLPQVLAAWDGPSPAFLLIDALDASRGGPAESAFRRLIEATAERSGRWTVVASIRTFDLRQGLSFRTLFKGTPPEPTLSTDGLAAVRHIQVPTWSEAEFEELLGALPRLAAVLRKCPGKLRRLAMVPFNTRLLAELVACGAVSGNFTTIGSQAALLSLYWDWRVQPLGTAAEVCLRRVVDEMMSLRALRASRLDVAAQNPAVLEALVGAGVLASIDRERSVQFRHHLLFDYVASRVFLDDAAVTDGTMAFPKSRGLGLLLGPAMGFLLGELWSGDLAHVRFWMTTSSLLGAPDCDPVIRSVAARMAAELPANAVDVVSFARSIGAGDPTATAALSHVAGAVAVELEDRPDAPLAPWVRLELELSGNPAPVAGALRMLAYMLIDRVGDPGMRADLGTAVRALLDHGYGLDHSRQLATQAIGFVADTMATDVEASAALLRKVLSEERFTKFGSEECPALTRKIGVIAPVSPGFATEVYRGVFARQVTDDRRTSLGGGSRIFNLTSNAQQDFESARWALKEYFPRFLAACPGQATRALLEAVDGYVGRRHPIPREAPAHAVRTLDGVIRIQADLSHIWGHEPHPQHAVDAEALLSRFETFLETGPEEAVMVAADYAVRNATLAVIWSRMFMAAAGRGGPLAGLLLRYAAQPGPLLCLDTRKDAVDLVASGYGSLQASERTAFEDEMLGYRYEEFTDPDAARTRLVRRLFGAIGAGWLETDRARQVIAGVPPEVADNPRPFQITTSSAEPDDYYWLDEATRSAPEARGMTASLDAVRKELRLHPDDKRQAPRLREALDALAGLRTRLDAGKVSDHALLRHAQNVFSQGVHALVRGGLISNETAPENVRLIANWIEAAFSSIDPEVDIDTEASFESSPGWSSPSGRIEAAEAALDLSLERPDAFPSLKPLIIRSLADAHPAVRMSAGRRLVQIWDLDRKEFWTRATWILNTEQNRSVLDFFVTGVLGQLVWNGAAREAADLILPLAGRWPACDPGNAGFRAHLVQITLQLWLQFGFEDAAAQVRIWMAAPLENVEEVRHAIIWFRGLYTAGLRGAAGAGDAAKRRVAIDLTAEAVRQAAEQIELYGDLAVLEGSQETRARGAVQILDAACQELYFGFGAFHGTNQDEMIPPLMADAARIFLNETTPTLRRIGRHGGSHTLYELLQLLEHLVDAEPANVFDLFALSLLQGGRSTGFEFESLAADLVVRVIGRYLADHKDVFDAPQQREALVDVLEKFVAAGWPSIRRLFYRLPDLLH